MSALRHGLSFDVEEAFHALNLWGAVPPGSWPQQTPRAEGVVERILERLAERQVRATFFVLGLVAERTPGVVRRIVAAGQERPATDGHRMAGTRAASSRTCVARARCRTFRQRWRLSRSTFSIGRHRWGAALAAAGHAWDSSVFLVRHDRYGDVGFPPHATSTCRAARCCANRC
jgi:hypothetical protein